MTDYRPGEQPTFGAGYTPWVAREQPAGEFVLRYYDVGGEHEVTGLFLKEHRVRVATYEKYKKTRYAGYPAHEVWVWRAHGG